METNGSSKLLEGILGLASLTSQILAHMDRSRAHSSPDAPPLEVVFEQLLGDVLRPIADRHPAADIETAATVLLDAVETIEAEIFLVDPSAMREA